MDLGPRYNRGVVPRTYEGCTLDIHLKNVIGGYLGILNKKHRFIKSTGFVYYNKRKEAFYKSCFMEQNNNFP